jgi:hypothetical protein
LLAYSYLSVRLDDIAMHVKKLSTPAEFEHYVDFARDVHRDNPYWVPTDKHHLVNLLSGNAGFGPGHELQPFAVGTTAELWQH